MVVDRSDFLRFFPDAGPDDMALFLPPEVDAAAAFPEDIDWPSVLAAVGGLAGLGMGFGAARLLRFALPELPVYTPWTYVVLAEIMAVVLGIVSGILPARRAARLDPVEALRDE